MSVLPVSTALQRLEQELLVESDRRIGTRVRIPSPQDTRGYCIVREALESEAARLFARGAGSSERAALRKAAVRLDEMYEASAQQAERASPESLHELRVCHMGFHLLIADGSGCPHLRQQIARNQYLVFNSFYDELFGSRRLPHALHSTLAEALAAGNEEAAEAAMRAHVRHHLDEIMRRLEPLLSLDEGRLAKWIGRSTTQSISIPASRDQKSVSPKRGGANVPRRRT